jgi:hypothetical protein
MKFPKAHGRSSDTPGLVRFGPGSELARVQPRVQLPLSHTKDLNAEYTAAIYTVTGREYGDCYRRRLNLRVNA